MSPTDSLESAGLFRFPDQGPAEFRFYAGGNVYGEADVAPPQSTTATRSLRTIIGRINAAIAPAVVVASFFGGVEPKLVMRRTTTAATGVVQTSFDFFTDEWRYAPEYITPAQVEELRGILALPLRSETSFTYLMEED